MKPLISFLNESKIKFTNSLYGDISMIFDELTDEKNYKSRTELKKQLNNIKHENDEDFYEKVIAELEKMHGKKYDIDLLDRSYIINNLVDLAEYKLEKEF